VGLYSLNRSRNHCKCFLFKFDDRAVKLKPTNGNFLSARLINRIHYGFLAPIIASWLRHDSKGVVGVFEAHFFDFTGEPSKRPIDESRAADPRQLKPIRMAMAYSTHRRPKPYPRT
jgi:hypothetical protein